MSDVKTVDIRGLLDTYEFPCKLPGSGQELMIKPITTGQMKKILAYEDETDPYKVEEALDKLISDCVLTEDFNIGSLYLQDRFYLLLEIRKVTKGEKYQFNWSCPKCSVKNIITVNLAELPVKSRDIDVDNTIMINEKLSFGVDFPTRADQIDAIAKTNASKMSFRERQVEVQTGTFANSIKKVYTSDGILENVLYEDKVYILDNIVSVVFETFSDWFAENDFGVEFKKDTVCMHCGNTDKVGVPLSDFFI